MLAGLMFILFGILIALFPRILVAMISTILILVGLGICATSWQWRRLRKNSGTSAISWIFRF